MTNLEYYKDELNKIMKERDCVFVNKKIGNAFEKFSLRHIVNYLTEPMKFIDCLLEEHKEPIKLKQWEYDVLNYHNRETKFNDNHFLMIMRSKGHFKDMNSVEKCSMPIKDILQNCEIVSDFYEGFEDCK